MLPAEPFDPYAPPRASRPQAHREGRRRWWLEGLARMVGVIAGFSLVADPTSLPGIETAAGRALGGYVLARAIGLILLALAFLPWRWRSGRSGALDGPVRRDDAEEL